MPDATRRRADGDAQDVRASLFYADALLIRAKAPPPDAARAGAQRDAAAYAARYLRFSSVKARATMLSIFADACRFDAVLILRIDDDVRHARRRRSGSVRRSRAAASPARRGVLLASKRLTMIDAARRLRFYAVLAENVTPKALPPAAPPRCRWQRLPQTPSRPVVQRCTDDS
jgi:hypothetical protein